ncbi:hypothetical protein ROM82_09395 [Cronobacter malonaticus]|uniref:hypothetical protein n=1 Tax=Cronobacter malonaticus TaxID=413503 RepID=UPI002895249C|nr:hypothetical protein [Cronobacter malonaticus]MDT3560481.1 hypothetical protein [Cronobacter malonaticus]
MLVEPIQVPKKLCIYSMDSRSDTLKFLNTIDTYVLGNHRAIFLDFSDVEFASAAASLLLFAIINRAQLMTGQPKLIRFKWPKKESNPQGHRWIVGTGLSKALVAHNSTKLEALTTEKRYFQSATEPFEQWLETLTMLSQHIDMTDEQFDVVSSAISEAMLNVSHHAYEKRGFDEHVELLEGKRWWQCSWFNVEKKKFVFIICDLGCGIHKSFSSASTLFAGLNEVASVGTALSVGQSRFLNAGRGNGSEDIKRPIGTGCVESETLLVLTGHAIYHYNSTEQVPECSWLNEYIPGTLVEWSLAARRG